MDDKIKSAFDAVRASGELKSGTRAFIARKSHNYTSGKALNYRKIIPLAAAAFTVLVMFTGIKLYLTPTTHITIDINPSLDLGINYFDKVVSVEPLNDDGKKLAETLDIKFSGYDEALRKILDNKSVEALLSENEVMTVTVIETNTAQSSNILSSVKACADEYSNVHCHSASSEDTSAARELGLSYERYRAFLQLQSLGYNINPEELNAMSMREIRDLIASLSGTCNDKDHLTSGGGHHGNGHGHS